MVEHLADDTISKLCSLCTVMNVRLSAMICTLLYIARRVDDNST